MAKHGNVQIRPATIKDAAALAELFEVLGFPCAVETMAQRLSVNANENLVAEVDELVVGVLTTHIMNVLHRPAPVGRISALVVLASYRGAGIGQALVAAAEQLLRQKGCGLLEITSHFSREQAHNFYKRLGYEATSFRFKKELSSDS